MKRLFLIPKKFIYSIVYIWRTARGKGINFGSRQGKPKAFLSRLMDLILWYMKNDEVLFWYYIYEFDIKTIREQKQYLSDKEYFKILRKQNRKLVDTDENLDYSIITYDKYVANNYLESVGVTAVHNEALIRDHKVYWSDGKLGNLESLLLRGFSSIFIKPVLGLGGGHYKA